MQKVSPERKILILAVAAVAAVLVIGLLTQRAASLSPPTTVGASASVEGAAISPMEIMIRRSAHLPVADPVEPF
jgi:hypothetical protein